MKPDACSGLSLLLMLAVLVGSAGCGFRSLGDSQAQLIQADQRLVISSPTHFAEGRNAPPQVVCAEPSPDVAKALGESFNLSGALNAVAQGRELPVEGALKAAAAISRARAESAAQLTNRLATIQLLRDTLYRACEAYRNGALSEITYAIMLSRFDKLMVTMLTGELVAGNFGQPLALFGTSASGSATASPAAVTHDAEQAATSKKAVDDARDALDTKRSELTNATAAWAACTDEPCKTTQRQVVETKRSEVATANDKLVAALANGMRDVAAAAISNASAILAQGVGASRAADPTQSQRDAQKTLEIMQQRYLENIHADPIIVSCITALERDHTDGTHAGRSAALVQFCKNMLPKVVATQHDLLRAKLITGPTKMFANCLAAYRDASAPDPETSAAAKPLKEFCDTHLLGVLQAYTEWTLKAEQFEMATRQVEQEGRMPTPRKIENPDTGAPR